MDSASNRSESRRFRFKLRTLFLIMTIAAIATIKVASDYRLVRERAAFWPTFNDHQYSLRAVGLHPRDEHVGIPWLRRLLGDSPCGSLMYDPAADPGGRQLDHVRKWFPEARIWGWRDRNLPEGIEPIQPDRHILI